MSAIDILRDALFGNPPSPATKPSREGVFAAFSELAQLVTASGIASTIYDTTAVGIAQTTTGQLFLVKGSGGSFADLYKNVSGTAVSQGLSLPSNAAVVDLVARANAAAALIDELEEDSARHDTEIATANAAIVQNIVAAVDETPSRTAAGSGLNGGVFDLVNGQITIPAGQTGSLSFAVYYIDLQREMLRAGDTVVFDLTLGTSTNLLAALAGEYILQVIAVVTVDGIAAEQLEQGSNLTITQISANEVRLTGEYVIKGGESERAGLYLQLAPGVPVSGSERFFRYKKTSYEIKSETGNTSSISRRDSDFLLTSGDISDVVSAEGQVFTGAEFIDGGRGIRIPVGSIGTTSYVRYVFDAAAIAKNAGATLLLTVYLRSTTDFDEETKLGADITVWHNGAPTYNNAKIASVKKINPRLIAVRAQYDIIGDETATGLYFQVVGAPSSVARTSEGSITLEQMYFAFAGYSFAGRSPSEMVIAWREQQLRESLNSAEVRYSETVTVKPDGSGDYTTLAAAFAARGGGKSLSNRILYKVDEGVYSQVGVTVPYFVDVVGQGRRNKVWFKGELPDNSALTSIADTSTFDMNGTARFFNCTITCRNMRYPFHSDANAFGITVVRAVQEIEDCHVEHYGNQGARAYQTSIGADPAAVWNSEHAWGCGTHSGERIYSRRTTWVSPTSAFYFHTNADFAEPCYVEVEGGSITCTTETGSAVILQPLGSGQPDRFVAKSVDIRGNFLVAPNPWVSQLQKNQIGDRSSEIQIHVEGCDAIPVYSANSTGTSIANVLELRSIDVAGSSVALSGTGALAMFGAQPDYVPGGVGYPGRVRSQFAITGNISGLGLGARLGNCTTTSKTLNIVFDGSVNRAITLNQNYTGMSNSQVVTALNTALADGTRVFQEIDPYADTNHLHQPEWESVMLNTDDTAILRGMAVAFDGGQYNAQVMYAGDPVSVFAGIALETFVAGQRGRVMIPGGRVHQRQVAFNGAASAAFGDVFGISSTPGLLIEGATVPLLRCVEVRDGQGIFRLLKAA